MYLFSEFQVFPFFILMILWAVGGWLISARLFDLKPVERHLIGFSLGLILSNWLSNLLTRILPMPFAFWASALIVLGGGILLAWPMRKDLRSMLSFSWGQWLAFALLAFFFTLINRGLAMLDDYAHLPLVSIMGAGNIPPQFPLDRNINFGYHYFLLLLGAQYMRVAGAAPWVALDLARGLTMTLFFLLAGLLAYWITDQPMAQVWGTFFAALAGGSRWLLLLLPPSIVSAISASLHLLGSTGQNGATLASLINGPWLIDGSGPVPFPFAFVSGINNPSNMALSGTGLFPFLIVVTLVLTAPRIRHRLAWLIISILLAALPLANEVVFGMLGFGLGLAILFWSIRNRSLRFPPSLRNWILVFVVSGFVAAFQGGMLTEIARGLLFKNPAAQSSYYDVGFRLVWPPTIVSAHLGSLSLIQPLQLLMALLEIGPVFLVFPLLLVRGWKQLSGENWLEAGVLFSGLVSFAAFFIEYSGTGGVRETVRLSGYFLMPATIYAVPLVWLYIQKKRQAFHILALTGALITVLSGIVLLSVQLYAMSKPVVSYYMNDLDAKAYQKYWNRLPSNAMVFDPDSGRAVTIFGRYTNTSDSWYSDKPEYTALVQAPDPYAVRAAGYDYMYYNYFYWLANKKLIDAPCAKLVDQFTDIHQATGESGDFRRLIDITSCTR